MLFARIPINVSFLLWFAPVINEHLRQHIVELIAISSKERVLHWKQEKYTDITNHLQRLQIWRNILFLPPLPLYQENRTYKSGISSSDDYLHYLGLYHLFHILSWLHRLWEKWMGVSQREIIVWLSSNLPRCLLTGAKKAKGQKNLKKLIPKSQTQT